MKQVHIPFLPSMEKAVNDGNKTATSRTKKYGEPGDTFWVLHKQYMLVSIDKKRLGDISTQYHKEEGFDSMDGFIQTWNTIHPIKKYNPEQIVYFHQFKLYYDPSRS